MSDQPLGYQSPQLAPTKSVAAAWISTLVLGILYALSGLCTLGSGLFVMAVVASQGSMPPLQKNLFFALMGGFSVILLGIGFLYILASVRIRRRSRTAVMVALTVCILNTVVTLGMGILGTAVVVMQKMEPQMFIGLAFYFVAAVANAIVAVFLFRAAKDLRPVPV